MSSPEIVLRTFGEELGIAGLSFDARGCMILQTESGRQLGIEKSGHVVLVHLSHPLSYEAPEWLLRAWKRAHHAQAGDVPTQVALRERDGERRLLVLVRVHEADLTVLRLRQTLEYLSRWLDALRHD